MDPALKDNLDPDGNGMFGLVCRDDGTFGSSPQFPAEEHCIEYPMCASLPRTDEWEDLGYALPAGVIDGYGLDSDTGSCSWTLKLTLILV